jgi:hypothetical protein
MNIVVLINKGSFYGKRFRNVHKYVLFKGILFPLGYLEDHRIKAGVCQVKISGER